MDIPELKASWRDAERQIDMAVKLPVSNTIATAAIDRDGRVTISMLLYDGVDDLLYRLTYEIAYAVCEVESADWVKEEP